MRLIWKTIFIGTLPLFTLFAQDGLHSSTVTFGVGGETPTYNVFVESSGPVFAGNYEYRIFKYLAVEGGFESMLPLTTQYEVLPVYSILPGSGVIRPCASGCVFLSQFSRTMVNLAPFGAKFVLPLKSGRVEAFAGGGGAYAFHSDGSYRNALLGQATVGGRIALDHGRRFWLGTSGRLFGNPGRERQEWLTWSADLGIRF